MNKTRLLVSLVVAVAATFVALRHRTLRQLEAEETQLRRQIEEAIELRAAISRTKTAPPAPTSAILSNPEHLELLGLRNEVGQLRRELAAEANQIAIQTANQMAKIGVRPVPVNAFASAETRGESRPTTHAGSQIYLCKGWGDLLIKHALENGGQLPATLADVAAKFGPQASGRDDFELVLAGNLNAIKFPSRTITLREKQPRKGNNGRWSRVYGFADGHVEVGSSATEDFTEWEREMTQIAPSPAR